MQGPSIKGKRNHQNEIEDEKDNKRKKLIQMDTTILQRTNIIQEENKLNLELLKEHFINIQNDKQEIQAAKIKKVYFKEISSNLIGYLLYFFSIKDCFILIKLSNKIKISIITKHKYFPLFIELKKNKTLKFQNLLQITTPSQDILKFEKFIIKELHQLNAKEKKIVLQEYLYSITEGQKLSCSVWFLGNFKEYTKLLLSYPLCPITIFEYNMSSSKIAELHEIIESNESIQSLSIRNFIYSEDIVNSLRFLESTKTIKKLHIHSMSDYNHYPRHQHIIPVYPNPPILFYNILNNSFSIEEIKFECLNINIDTSFGLSNFIKMNKTIKSLVLNKCNYYSDIFGNSLKHNDQLESLSLSWQYPLEGPLKALAKELNFQGENYQKENSLSSVSKLKHISFVGCRLGKRELDIVTQIVSSNTNIVSLDISHNDIHSNHIELIKTIVRSKNLQKLNLTNTKLSAKDFKIICEELKLNDNLESINFTGNKCICSDEKIYDLFEANKTIKEFIITGNRFDKNIEDYINEIMLARRPNAR